MLNTPRVTAFKSQWCTIVHVRRLTCAPCPRGWVSQLEQSFSHWPRCTRHGDVRKDTQHKNLFFGLHSGCTSDQLRCRCSNHATAHTHTHTPYRTNIGHSFMPPRTHICSINCYAYHGLQLITPISHMMMPVGLCQKTHILEKCNMFGTDSSTGGNSTAVLVYR